MSLRKTLTVAAFSASLFLGTQATASLADDRAAVLAAMNERVVELNLQIDDLRFILPSLSGTVLSEARSEIRLLTTRRNQLMSFSRIVNRSPATRLAGFVDYFGLSVSLS